MGEKTLSVKHKGQNITGTIKYKTVKGKRIIKKEFNLKKIIKGEINFKFLKSTLDNVLKTSVITKQAKIKIYDVYEYNIRKLAFNITGKITKNGDWKFALRRV